LKVVFEDLDSHGKDFVLYIIKVFLHGATSVIVLKIKASKDRRTAIMKLKMPEVEKELSS
jgi:hypothetical protein